MEKFILHTSKLHKITEANRQTSGYTFGNLELLDNNISKNLTDILGSQNETIELFIDHKKESVSINGISIDEDIQSMPLDIEESKNQGTYRHIASAMQQARNMGVFEEIFQKVDDK